MAMSVAAVCNWFEASTRQSEDKAVQKNASRETVTIWILSYERRDASPLSDEVYLGNKVDAAQEKLKGLGARRIRFNYAEKQVAL
jgi:hypothetical protein